MINNPTAFRLSVKQTWWSITHGQNNNIRRTANQDIFIRNLIDGTLKSFNLLSSDVIIKRKAANWKAASAKRLGPLQARSADPTGACRPTAYGGGAEGGAVGAQRVQISFLVYPLSGDTRRLARTAPPVPPREAGARGAGANGAGPLRAIGGSIQSSVTQNDKAPLRGAGHPLWGSREAEGVERCEVQSTVGYPFQPLQRGALNRYIAAQAGPVGGSETARPEVRGASASSNRGAASLRSGPASPVPPVGGPVGGGANVLGASVLAFICGLLRGLLEQKFGGHYAFSIRQAPSLVSSAKILGDYISYEVAAKGVADGGSSSLKGALRQALNAARNI